MVEFSKRRGNVVAMSSYVTDIRFPPVSEVESYWDQLRGDRPAPFRSEIDPRRIEHALEYAFIVERIAPGLGRFRLAGMHLNDLMGMEVRGMPLTSFFVPAARRRMSDIVEAVFQAPGVAEIGLSAERGIGKPAIDARLILLPLRSDLGDVSRVLGCLASVGVPGRTPRRFEITEVLRSPAPLAVAPDPDGAPHDHELAETRRAFRAAAADPAAPRRPDLRVVTSKDD